MSLKQNVLASYASQIFVALVGVVTLPMYIRYMGSEAYGLVGFFVMLQSWFNLLDLGLSPTVARETARFRAGATDVFFYRNLLRALQLIFSVVALLGGLGMFVASGWIARSWLNADALPLQMVTESIKLMALTIALRWMSGLYRGCITGSEKLVWLGAYNALMAGLRFLGVLVVLVWVDHSPVAFFTYQLAVGVVELLGLYLYADRISPGLPAGQKPTWAPSLLFKPLAPVLKFSLSIAFTSSVWVVVTQTDKLLLSRLIPLADYGYFTLAVLLANGVMIVSVPMNVALLPRMAKLQTEGDEPALLRLYGQATQAVNVIAIPACLMLALFSEQVLWAWTGDAIAVDNSARVLTLYAWGNGVLALSSFPYYLQYAKGDLKFHLIGSVLFVVVLIPSLIWITQQSGIEGAGWTWLAANSAYFLFWVPLVHRHLAPGLHGRWMAWDVTSITLPVVAVAWLLRSVAAWPTGRVETSIQLGVFAGLLVAVAGIASPEGRIWLATGLSLIRQKWPSRAAKP